MGSNGVPIWGRFGVKLRGVGVTFQAHLGDRCKLGGKIAAKIRVSLRLEGDQIGVTLVATM
jgi:hypothetical protein